MPQLALTDTGRRGICLYREENPGATLDEIGDTFGDSRRTALRVLSKRDKYLHLDAGNERCHVSAGAQRTERQCISVINLLATSAAAFVSPTVVFNSQRTHGTSIIRKRNMDFCSSMIPKAPKSEAPEDSSIHPMFNYQIIHIEGYVLHVDVGSQHEVAFKLTPGTIKSLVDYHKEVYSVDAAANTWDWPEKETQLKQLPEEFVQAAKQFVFQTDAGAL
ncbi:hypothetical protein VTO42DRAFT_8842 [Malbranchea cinnamomea]